MDEQMIEEMARAMKPNLFRLYPNGCSQEHERTRAMARVAHSVIAGKVAELEALLADAVVLLLNLGAETGPGTVVDEANAILRELDDAAVGTAR